MLLSVWRVLTNLRILGYCQYSQQKPADSLHRAADWSRSLDVIQLADILGCAYWCLFVKKPEIRVRFGVKVRFRVKDRVRVRVRVWIVSYIWMHRRQRGLAVRIHTDNSQEMTHLSVRPVLTITLTQNYQRQIGAR